MPGVQRLRITKVKVFKGGKRHSEECALRFYTYCKAVPAGREKHVTINCLKEFRKERTAFYFWKDVCNITLYTKMIQRTY